MGSGQSGHEKFDLDYVLRRSPTYVVVAVHGLLPAPRDPVSMVQPDYAFEYAMLSSDAFHDRYEPLVAQTPGGYFLYFQRRTPATLRERP